MGTTSVIRRAGHAPARTDLSRHELVIRAPPWQIDTTERRVDARLPGPLADRSAVPV
jgi:hypothetical protein